MQRVAQIIVYLPAVALAYVTTDYSKVPALVKLNHNACIKEIAGASAGKTETDKLCKSICENPDKIHDKIGAARQCHAPLIIPELEKSDPNIRARQTNQHFEKAIFALTICNAVVKECCGRKLTANADAFIKDNVLDIAKCIANDKAKSPYVEAGLLDAKSFS